MKARRSTVRRRRPARRPISAAELTGEVLRDLDDERRGLARRLHDSAQQSLAVVSMALSLLERQAPDLPAPARASLGNAMAAATKCHQELREIAHALHPGLLEELGLGPALRGLGARLGGERLLIADPAPLPRVDGAVETAAYWVIEAALRWVFTTAPVRFAIAVTPGAQLTFTLSGQAQRNAERGLARLRLRLESAGGRLRVRRRPLRLDVAFSRT